MILVCVFVIALYGVLLHLSQTKAMKSGVEVLGGKVLTQANLHLERYLSSYNQSLLLLSYSREMVDFMALTREDRTQHYSLSRALQAEYIQPFFSYFPELEAIILTNAQGSRMTFSRRFGLQETVYDSYIDSLIVSDAGSPLSYASGLVPYFELQGETVQSAVIHIWNHLEAKELRGMIQFDVSMNPALEILKNMELGERGSGMVVDSDFRIVAHSDSQLLGEHIPEEMIRHMQEKEGKFNLDGNKELIMYDSLEGTSWKTVVGVTYEELAPVLGSITKVTIVIAAISLFFSVVLSQLAASRFTKRIHLLRKGISLTEKGRWEKRVDIRGEDEIAELNLAFNRMLDSLDNTVNHLADTRLKHREATMSALQSQIDSHFLYNTLETISSRAYLAGEHDIEEVVVSLAEMLRYSADFRHSVVSVRDELEQLANYMEIMMYRYGERIEYTITFDPACEGATCLKSIIQPLAENSIKHGLEEGIERIHIKISVFQPEQGMLCIEVVDNGTGYPIEVLHRLQRQMRISPQDYRNAEGQVGLMNVHRRVQVYYSEEKRAGLYLENQEHAGGASARILFPYQSSVVKGA